MFKQPVAEELFVDLRLELVLEHAAEFMMESFTQCLFVRLLRSHCQKATECPRHVSQSPSQVGRFWGALEGGGSEVVHLQHRTSVGLALGGAQARAEDGGVGLEDLLRTPLHAEDDEVAQKPRMVWKGKVEASIGRPRPCRSLPAKESALCPTPHFDPLCDPLSEPLSDSSSNVCSTW